MTKTLPIVRLVTAAWVALAVLSAPQAEAHETHAVVRIGDLDANSPSDARMLLRRIEGAAARVCDATLATYYVSLRRAYRECQQQSVLRAVERSGQPGLRQAYEARYRAR